jgi:hypothetical protein
MRAARPAGIRETRYVRATTIANGPLVVDAVHTGTLAQGSAVVAALTQMRGETHAVSAHPAGAQRDGRFYPTLAFRAGSRSGGAPLAWPLQTASSRVAIPG